MMIVLMLNSANPIMDRVCMNDDCVKRLQGDEKNAEDIMNQIKQSNPDYEFPDQFTSIY